VSQLKHRHILLKELLKLPFGKHCINDIKDGVAVFVVELLD